MDFLRAIIENYHKSASLKQQEYIFSVWKPEVQKSRVHMVGFFWDLKENPFYISLLDSSGFW